MACLTKYGVFMWTPVWVRCACTFKPRCIGRGGGGRVPPMLLGLRLCVCMCMLVNCSVEGVRHWCIGVGKSPSYTPGFKATYVYVGELLCRNCQTLVHWRGKESLRYFRVLGYVCVYVGELLCQWCQTLVHWSRGESPRCSWVQGYMCVCWWTVLPKVSDIGAVLSICDWICEKGTTCTISECLFSSRHQPSKLNAGGL